MIEIIKKSECCGCGACSNICPRMCIDMQEDSEGFLYPKVDANVCIDCGLCQKVCPIINKFEPHRPIKIYAAKNKNEHERKESSSGGIFIVLAHKIIDEGGVVFGASFNDDWEVLHACAQSLEEVRKFQGSKYVQSVINDTYRLAEKYLKDGRKVLFTGTPCQIAGLNHYLRKNYPNLLTADIICHGVPSPLVWRNYLNEIKKHYNEDRLVSSIDGKKDDNHNEIRISKVSFRDKILGWKKFSFSYRLIRDSFDGKIDDYDISCVHLENTYMKGFLNNYYLRPSCHSCPARMGRSHSDITMADFWKIGKYFEDDDKGTSLLLIHTKKAYDFFPFDSFEYNETTYEALLDSNPSFFNNHLLTYKRKQFWKEYSSSLSLEKTIDKLAPRGAERLVMRFMEIYRKMKLRYMRYNALKK